MEESNEILLETERILELMSDAEDNLVRIKEKLKQNDAFIEQLHDYFLQINTVFNTLKTDFECNKNFGTLTNKSISDIRKNLQQTYNYCKEVYEHANHLENKLVKEEDRSCKYSECLNKAIQEQNKEIQYLERILNQVEEKEDEFKIENNRILNENKQLEIELKRILKQLNDTEINSLENEIMNENLKLKTALKIQEKNKIERNEYLKKIQKDISEILVKNDENFTELQKENNSLENQLTHSTEILEQKIALNEKINNELLEFEKIHKNFEEKITETTEKIIEHEQSIKKLKENAEHEINLIKAKNMEKIKKTSDENDLQIKLSSEIKNILKTESEITDAINISKNETTKLIEKNVKLREEFEKITQQFESNSTELKKLTDALSDHRANLTQKQTRLDELSKTNETISKEHDDKTHELRRTFTEEIEPIKTRIEAILTNTKRVELEIQHAQTKLEALQNDERQTREDLQKLLDEKTEMHTKREALKEEYRKIREKKQEAVKSNEAPKTPKRKKQPAYCDSDTSIEGEINFTEWLENKKKPSQNKRPRQ